VGKVEGPISNSLSNSAYFEEESTHEIIFDISAIENHEFSKKD